MLAGHFQWTEGVGLLSVHQKFVGKVRWTRRSDQKCSDKHRKIIGKLQWLKIKSGYPKSDRVGSEKQWECKDLSSEEKGLLVIWNGGHWKDSDLLKVC